MSRFFTAINLVLISLAASVLSATDDLKSVVVLYRHGDRAPIQPYNTDPYADKSFWPLGFGQLTNIGKKRQYSLGQWLRERYSDFLPSSYNKNEIKIQSSNVDRCLMSAQLNLAGLYPPQGDQIWNEKLRWQPIPVHTVPETEDAVLAQWKPCPKYTKLYQEVVSEEPFNTTLEKYSEQMKFFAASSLDNVTTLEQLQDLYNIVYIENLYNLTLPEWTKSILTDEIKQVVSEAWASYAYTEDLARLRAGPLIDVILSHFESAKNNIADTPKFLMLSAHDSTIAPLLTAMKVFDNEWPDFASSVLFELREGEKNEFVNIFYRNSDEVANLTLPDCVFDCDFDVFQKSMEPIRIGSEDWDKECQEV